MAFQRLTVAYRSRTRPSSTLGAKASTVCPYYLDGDQAPARHEVGSGPVIPVFSRRLSMAADVASVQFSRTARRLNAGRPSPAHWAHARAGGRRSLKTQQHAGRFVRRRSLRIPSRQGGGASDGTRPGSVDMLGPIRVVAAAHEARRPQDRGTAWCSLERR
jgi:hypothetical protein